MNTDDRLLLNAKIGELLYRALVDIRNFTYPAIPDEPDRREELNELADLLHNLPRYIVGHDEYAIDSFDQFRGAVVDHVKRFYPTMNPEDHRYVRLLDMDEASFAAEFRCKNWPWPESQSATSH